METLLPSEVARLVLGYLQDHCEEAAKVFLEQSPHLTECLELAKQGRKYTTKVMGNSLMDLLQEYCAVHYLVSERSQKLPETAAEQLKQSAGLVQKLKFLIDASKSGQTFLLSITVPSQGSSNQTTNTPSSGRSKSWLQSSSERAKRTSVRSQKSKEKEEKPGRRSSSTSVEATPLHSLPGLSPSTGHSVASSQDQLHNETTPADNKDGNTPSCSSTPKRKAPLVRKKLCASLSKFKKSYPEDESNESVDIVILQQALLENKQLHEKIAENINRVLQIPSDGPSESQLPAVSPDTLAVPCDGMLNELDQAIKTIVHRTEQDPLFENFLEEILGPVEEEVTSSPGAGDCETDTEETGSGSPQATPLDDESLNTPTGHRSLCMPGEVPLKQRLRSARNRVSDGYSQTPSTPHLVVENPDCETQSPATKELKKKESLLEEQNAAAIQSIITVNIENADSTKTDDLSELSSENNPTKRTKAPVKIIPGKKDVETSVSVVADSVTQTCTVAELGDGVATEASNPDVQCLRSAQQPIAANGGSSSSFPCASLTVPVSIQSSFLWESVPVILSTTANLSGTALPFVQPVPVSVPVTVDKGQMLLAVEGSVPTPGVTVSVGSQQSSASSSSIILYGREPTFSHFQPINTTSTIYQSPLITSVDSTQTLSIAPKATKSKVAETEGIAEKVVLASSTQNVIIDLAKSNEKAAETPVLNRETLGNKSQNGKKKKKHTVSHTSKKLSHSRKRKKGIISHDQDSVVRNKDEINLPSESSIIIVDDTTEISFNMPDISSNSPVRIKETVPNKVLSSIKNTFSSSNKGQVTNETVPSTQSFEASSSLNIDEVNQDKIETRETLQNNNTENTAEQPINSAHEDVNCTITNTRSDDSQKTTNKIDNIKQNVNADKPRHTTVTHTKLNKNTVEKSVSTNLESKPRQTPHIRRPSNVSGGRLSLSTPRRRTSHIRALDFSTPPKSSTGSVMKRRSSSAPKDTIHEMDSTSSPGGICDMRAQQAKNVRSSLFKSPDLPVTKQDTGISTPTPSFPIATRSPAPKLSGGWERVTGAGLIFCDSPSVSESPEISHSNKHIQIHIEEVQNSGEVKTHFAELVSDSDDCISDTTGVSDVSVSKQDVTPKQDEALAVWKRSISNYSKSKDSRTRAWDADLRAIVLQDYEDGAKKSNSVKGKRRTSKKKKKAVDKTTEEEARLVESRLNSIVDELAQKESSEQLLFEGNTSNVELRGDEDNSEVDKSRDCSQLNREKISESNENPEKQMPAVMGNEKCTVETDFKVVNKLNSDNKGNSENECAVDDNTLSAAILSETSVFVQPEAVSRNRKRKLPTNTDELAKKRQKVKTGTKVKGRKSKVKFQNEEKDNEGSSLATACTSQESVVHASAEKNDLQVNENEKEIVSTAVMSNAFAPMKQDKLPPVENSEGKSLCNTSMYQQVNSNETLSVAGNLKTPRKESPTIHIMGADFQIPVTPRIMSPHVLLDTPISNFLREQPSVDLSMIPTPNFPPTPNIAITPHSAELSSPSSYRSRPTDYSSCSSYYKPSHSPSRTLEQVLIDECNRIESNVHTEKCTLQQSQLDIPEKEVIGDHSVIISSGEEINLENSTVIDNNCSENDIKEASRIEGNEVLIGNETPLSKSEIEKATEEPPRCSVNISEVKDKSCSLGQEKQEQNLNNSCLVSSPTPTDHTSSIDSTHKRNDESSLSTNSELAKLSLSIKKTIIESHLQNCEKLGVSNSLIQTDTFANNQRTKGNSNICKSKCADTTINNGRTAKRRVSRTAIDKSVTSELEMKKKRLIAKLKGESPESNKTSKVKDLTKKGKQAMKCDKSFESREGNKNLPSNIPSKTDDSPNVETSESHKTCEISADILPNIPSVKGSGTPLKVSQESSPFKSVSNNVRGAEISPAVPTPQKGNSMRRQGISVDTIAERLLMEAQNPQVNKAVQLKETGLRKNSEQHVHCKENNHEEGVCTKESSTIPQITGDDNHLSPVLNSEPQENLTGYKRFSNADPENAKVDIVADGPNMDNSIAGVYSEKNANYVTEHKNYTIVSQSNSDEVNNSSEKLTEDGSCGKLGKGVPSINSAVNEVYGEQKGSIKEKRKNYEENSEKVRRKSAKRTEGKNVGKKKKTSKNRKSSEVRESKEESFVGAEKLEVSKKRNNENNLSPTTSLTQVEKRCKISEDTCTQPKSPVLDLTEGCHEHDTGKVNEEGPPSVVVKKCEGGKDMYVIIKYDDNGPQLPTKEADDLSHTTFTLMDDTGLRTLTVTKNFDLLSLSPEKYIPRNLNMTSSVQDFTSVKAAATKHPSSNEEEAYRGVHAPVISVDTSHNFSHAQVHPRKQKDTRNSRNKVRRETRRESEVKHSHSHYKYRKKSESRSPYKNKGKRLFQSPDKILSKYRHSINRRSPRRPALRRDRSVTPSTLSSRRRTTEKMRHRSLKSAHTPTNKHRVNENWREREASRFNIVDHKYSYERSNIYSVSKRTTSSSSQDEIQKREQVNESQIRKQRTAALKAADIKPRRISSHMKKSSDVLETDSTDDLMTYALIGSERGEESNSSVKNFVQTSAREISSDSPSSSAVATSSNEETKTLPPKKRKPSQEDGPVQMEKRMHTQFPQKLLQAIDVDNFLNFVHNAEKANND